MSKKFCLALDLKNEPDLISMYEKYHQPGNIWPEIVNSIYDAGVIEMEIYRIQNRLFMIMEVDDHFSFEKKQKMDNSNKKVIEWEALMQEKFQQALPGEATIQWKLMDRIFNLSDCE